MTKIEWNNYSFIIEVTSENDRIEISVIDLNITKEIPGFELALKKLEVDKYFKNGDYYQESMNKGLQEYADPKKSYAAIIHEFLLNHKDEFSYIKNIFSSPLFPERDTGIFMSAPTINFWSIQMNKKPNFPVYYNKTVKRFQFHLND